MMRSPYRTPKDPLEPRPHRFLRLPPREQKRKRRAILLGGGLLLGYLIYSFVGTDSGLIRIRALRRETRELERRKVELTAAAREAEQRRKSLARDDLLPERIARERFHLVKKDELLYRYQAEEDSAR